MKRRGVANMLWGNVKIPSGLNGKSAYEIAVLNGFIGTEAEWLTSLQGDNGYTPQKGVDYFDGDDGHTPYIQGGYWWINGVNTGVIAQGTNGRGVVGVVLVSTVGKVKTYRMNFTDSSYYEYQVTDGADGSGGGGVEQIDGITISASGWVADGSLYKYVLSNANITASHIVEIVPDNSAYDILVVAKPLQKTTSVAGAVTMWVHSIPTGDFTVTLNLYTKTA